MMKQKFLHILGITVLLILANPSFAEYGNTGTTDRGPGAPSDQGTSATEPAPGQGISTAPPGSNAVPGTTPPASGTTPAPNTNAVPGSSDGTPAPEKSIEDEPAAYKLEIVSPTEEETFQNNTQNLTVVVKVTPKLRKADKLVLYVDGQQLGEPTSETTIIGPWQPRGEHTVQVKIASPKGSTGESTIIKYYQQRVSSLLPAS